VCPDESPAASTRLRSAFGVFLNPEFPLRWVHSELGSGGGLTMKKKPKAAVGDRYDVILTDGGDHKIEVARIVKEITGRHRVSAELTELF
jgi:hypothetical protein